MTLLVFLHKIGLQAGPGRCVQNLSKGVLPINELAQSVGPNLPAFLGTTGAEKSARKRLRHPIGEVDGRAAVAGARNAMHVVLQWIQHLMWREMVCPRG